MLFASLGTTALDIVVQNRPVHNRLIANPAGGGRFVPSRFRRSFQILAACCLCGVTFAGVGASAVNAQAAGEVTKEQKQALAEIRLALAQRDLEVAEDLIAKAKAAGGPETHLREVERLDTIQGLLVQFWKAVDRGANSIPGMEEIVIGETRAAFVDYENGVMTLRVAGENRKYTFKTVKAKLSVTIALRVLDDKAASTKAIVGAFWAMDALGDRAAAKRLWTEAKQAGEKIIDELLPELDVAPAKPIDIPMLPPQARQLLSTKNWQKWVPDAKRVARDDVGAMGMQNEEGRLVLKHTGTETVPVQVVYKRKVAGNFVARVILQDVEEGQTFGLFASDPKDGSHVISLPGGTVKVELSRTGTTFTCKINDQETEVESSDGAQPRLAGQIGISFPIGTGCTIAAFDLR